MIDDVENRSIGDKRWVRIIVWVIVAVMLLPVVAIFFRLIAG